MSLVISCAVGQQAVTEEVLASPAKMVSINRTWDGWFDSPGVPAQIRAIHAAGKKAYLRVLAGVFTGADALARVEKINIVWQGTAYQWPLVWGALYLKLWKRFLTNRLLPLMVPDPETGKVVLGEGDWLGLTGAGVESAECYWPDEAAPIANEAFAQMAFAECARALTGWDVMAPPPVKLALNCSRILSDWAVRVLPALQPYIDAAGNNVLTGDPEQPEVSQQWICKGLWGLPGRLGEIGGYFHQKPCPEGMTQEEHLLGMIAKCQAWGMEVLELNPTLCLMFPGIVEAAQA